MKKISNRNYTIKKIFDFLKINTSEAPAAVIPHVKRVAMRAIST